MSDQPSVLQAPRASFWRPLGHVIVERVRESYTPFSLVALKAVGYMCVAPNHGGAMFHLSNYQPCRSRTVEQIRLERCGVVKMIQVIGNTKRRCGLFHQFDPTKVASE